MELVEDNPRREKYSANARKRAGEFTLTKLIGNLDLALTREIEEESGLAKLPKEVRSTLSEPEVVARTWSHGSRKLVATNKRVFIQQGRLSRSTAEIPYSNISSIEHIRRYNWRTIVIGAALSVLMLIQHYVFPIVSRTLTSKIDIVAASLLPGLRVQLLQALANLWLVPISFAILLFLIRARTGYAIQGAKLSPVFLPHSFKEPIQYIQEKQDLRESTEGTTTRLIDEEKE
jgi:hypothetical protein